MLASSDSWIALPGNTSQTQHEHLPLVYPGQLGGVPLCESHFLGLQTWYWAQAVALSQTQRSMAEDQWIPDPQTMEAGGSYFGLEESQVDRYPNTASISLEPHYDYIEPLFDNGFWSRVPYAQETQPLTPPRPPPALPYVGASGSPHGYPVSWDQTQDLAGGCYRMDLDDPEVKHEDYTISLPSLRPCCADQWATASPEDLRFAPSLSPDLAASPPMSPGVAVSPNTPGKSDQGRPRKPLRDSRPARPAAATRRRRARASTPEPVNPRTVSNSVPDDRAVMDDFLVRSRLSGKSYRDIRRLGGFAEAESTLRGRFRALTKRKEERVRRPEWSDVDIKLLRKAVRKLGKGKGPAWLKKIAWKEVSEYIVEHGGTYRFGNATCRKKWDELAEAEGY